jgi:glycosyltransferase involved in cell wall biosynthesis
MSSDLTATIAICTWNRCELLRQTLARLADVPVPSDLDWDILVVNNHCSDRTSDVVADFRGVLPIREVSEPRPGLSHARNRALSTIITDYVVWIDDDVLVSERWLIGFASAVRAYPRACAFGGPIEPWFVVPPDPALLDAFPSLRTGFCGIDYGSREVPLDRSQPIYGANMAFAMSAVGALRFNSSLGVVQGTGLGGEEVEFIDRLCGETGEVIWIPDMRVKHYVDPSRMTLPYLTNYSYNGGRTLIRLGRPRDEPQLFGAPRWVWPLAVRAFLRYWTLRFFLPRRAALESTREYYKFRGMLAESFARSRSNTDPAADA